jgi:archaellum biogenesis protein FlaJ (TadC family)
MIIFSVFIIVNGTEMAFINLSVQISTRFFEIFFVVRVLNRLKTDMIIKFQSKKTKKEKIVFCSIPLKFIGYHLME